MTNANGAASAAPLAIRENTTIAELDRLELVVEQSIESVKDPDKALELLGKVKTAAEALRHVKWGQGQEQEAKARLQKWHGYKIRAEHRYGELLPPKQPGPKPTPIRDTRSQTPIRDTRSQTPIRDTRSQTPDPERQAQSRARQVAAVPKAKVEEYIKTDPQPTRAGLLRSVKPPAPPKRKPAPAPVDPRNRRGKRPTKAERKAVLWRLHDTVMELCAKLEHIDPRVCDVSDPKDLAVLVDVRNALIDLEVWKGDVELSINSKIGDQGIREKITALRNPAGKYPAELKRCQEVADELERKLNNKLKA